jgi:hypothetical protein
MSNFLCKLKLVYFIKNKLPILLGKIFTKPNLNKVIIIFIVGFISRFFVGNIYKVNVYLEYLNVISVFYYLCMSIFIVILHELIDYFGFNIIPSCLFELSSFFVNIYKNIISSASFVSKTISSANKHIFSIKLSDLKISSIREYFKLYLNKEKLTMGVDPSNKKNIEIIDNKVNNNVLQKNTHTLKSSRGRSIKVENSSNNNNNTRSSRPENNITNSRPGDNTTNSRPVDNTTSSRPENNTTNSRPGDNTTNFMPLEGLLFRVDSMYSNASGADFVPIPAMPPAPNLDASRLTTPSISTIKTSDTPRYPSSVYSVHDSDITPAYPVPAQAPYFNPYPVAAQAPHYNTAPVAQQSPYYNTAPVSGQASYYNTAPVAAQARYSAPLSQSEYLQDMVTRKHEIITQLTHPDKEVYFSPITDEISIKKRGIKGKLKLAVNYMDNKLHKGASNIESIAVKYSDKTKRIIVWNL